MLNKFENCHDMIKNGCPLAILVTGGDVTAHFFPLIISISCTVIVYDLKSLIVKKNLNAVHKDCRAPILVASHGRIQPH